ncbi:MAG TPA: pentapeptide repeat-containing protein [Chloroflexota bacterium]|jgi:uncharacterized protein YjbI with pentapeptide repeats|nr:pentapeptide repeat-containing protein [Chloroflexota bacterium]
MPQIERDPRSLQADCANCVALCCVALAFTISGDFAINKPAGVPCPHLQNDFRCGIHAQLRQRGFKGCAVYDCFGAGQRVSQVTFAGVDWRQQAHLAAPMFAAFGVMRQLHELLWHLTEALRLPAAYPIHPELRTALAETERLANLDRDALLNVEVAAHRDRVNQALRRASKLARSGVEPPGQDYSAADLIGKDLRNTNLRGGSLRGAQLIGATLCGMDFHLTDFTGTDLRAADLRRANLQTSLFLTQSQLESAIGDTTTRLPAGRTQPAHWSSAATVDHE